MSDVKDAVEVELCHKTFHIKCDRGDEAKLLAAARLLEERIQQFPKHGATREDVFAIAAMNLMHELTDTQNKFQHFKALVSSQSKQLLKNIEKKLAKLR